MSEPAAGGPRTKIVIGLLLFVFCLMQRVFEASAGKSRGGVYVSRVATPQSAPNNPP